MVVKERFPEVEYMIVGGEMPGHEAYAQKVESLVSELGFGKVVHMAGSQSDVVVLSSSGYRCPTEHLRRRLGVPIEAMALENLLWLQLSAGSLKWLSMGRQDSWFPNMIPKPCPGES